MKRYLLSKFFDGSFSRHGTALYLPDDDIWITDLPLDPSYLGMGRHVYVALQGEPNGGARVLEVSEVVVAAPGTAVATIAPYVYRLKLEMPK